MCAGLVAAGCGLDEESLLLGLFIDQARYRFFEIVCCYRPPLIVPDHEFDDFFSGVFLYAGLLQFGLGFCKLLL